MVLNSLLQAIKPTVLIGSSGVGKTFTKEVIEAMASFNEVIPVFWFSGVLISVQFNCSEVLLSDRD